MKRRLAIAGSMLAVIFTIIYLIDSNFGKDKLDVIAVLRTTSSAALISFFLYALWNYLLWRIKPFVKWHKKPIIRGTWIAETEFKDKKGAPLVLELRIHQSFDDISIVMKSREFTSISLISKLIQDSSGSYLYFTYVSKPRKKYFNIHQVHHGTMRLHCQELVLIGEYFTSAFMGGNVEFYKRGIDATMPEETASINQQVINELEEDN